MSLPRTAFHALPDRQLPGACFSGTVVLAISGHFMTKIYVYVIHLLLPLPTQAANAVKAAPAHDFAYDSS